MIIDVRLRSNEMLTSVFAQYVHSIDPLLHCHKRGAEQDYSYLDWNEHFGLFNFVRYLMWMAMSNCKRNQTISINVVKIQQFR